MINLSCSREAPEGKFRVIGIDLFDREGWKQQDCDTLEKAIGVADMRSGEMLKMHVHSDKGELLYEAGTYSGQGSDRKSQLKSLCLRSLLSLESFVDLV